MKCSKFPGHDNISVKVIMDAVDILANPLAAIFNSSMEEGGLPEGLETSYDNPDLQVRAES